MTTQRVGVVGLGLMGQGICTALLARGISTVAVDIRPQSLASAEEQIAASLHEHDCQVHEQAAAPADWRSHFHVSSTLAPLADCDFIIESLPEQLDLKRASIAEIEDIVAPSTPIASNTSALPITMIQAGMQNPQRILGMHWAEPCHLTRFLEIIRGDQTDEASARSAMEIGKRLGKDPTMVQRDVPGFIVNRLAYAMYREAFWLLENEVADVETIDRAFVNALSVWANIAGPFRWMDLTGLAAYGQVMERLFPELSRATEVPARMRELLAAGAQGIANGRGFYDYDEQEADAWRAKLIANVQSVNRATAIQSCISKADS